MLISFYNQGNFCKFDVMETAGSTSLGQHIECAKAFIMDGLFGAIGIQKGPAEGIMGIMSDIHSRLDVVANAGTGVQSPHTQLMDQARNYIYDGLLRLESDPSALMEILAGWRYRVYAVTGDICTQETREFSEYFDHVRAALLANEHQRLAKQFTEDTGPALIQANINAQLEQAERLAKTLIQFKTDFDAHPELHEGLNWERVEETLLANPSALESVAKMIVAGHEPNVYNFDAEGFDIGTCSTESPVSGRNCVYDAQAAAWLPANYYQDAQFNGNAVEMAEAMGIRLMSPAQYSEVLQRKGKFDRQTWSLLLTDEATLEAGGVFYGGRPDGDAGAYKMCYCPPNDNLAWRGSLRVLWA